MVAHIGSVGSKKCTYNLDTLTRHAGILGTTGSGKTVMCKVLVEEALLQGLPIIAIDPKGDIGGLGIADENYNFSPFVKGAQSVAQKHVEQLLASGVDISQAKKIADVKTTIYTPKSSVGRQVSLIPKLDAPENFKEKSEEDPAFVASFVEPISESICQLASIKGAIKEKAQVLVSAILIHYWNEEKDLTIESLLPAISSPPFEDMGGLALEDFINEKERKKIVASLNLLLTSPSKQVWKHGNPLDVAAMFKPRTLSIFDLRYVSQEEKQMVVEQIMQEIYKFLLNKGGSEKLKYIFYIDELAGLLPPPPANPPSKKLLGLLIRQARAFGLGIIVATQNPGDIDYKILGNIGTRFVGKLRTENDIEKVATAMDMSPSVLKEDIAKLKTGDFVYNNAVENKTQSIHARWLYTYHGGPLQPQEIKWINDPVEMPEKSAVSVKKSDIASKVSASKEKSASKKKSTIDTKNLSDIEAEVKKYSDEYKVKISLTESTTYVPHLRIVIEPKEYRTVKPPLKGPYLFDLTHKSIPQGNYLANRSWKTQIPKVSVLKAKRSIKEAFQYSIADAKQNLKCKYYHSDLTGLISASYQEVLKDNKKFLAAELKDGSKAIVTDKKNEASPVKEAIAKNNKKISELKRRIRMKSASRLVKKVIGKKRVGGKTQEVKRWESMIDKLKKENKKLRQSVKKVSSKHKDRQVQLSKKAEEKARTKITEYSYNPNNADLIVHASILLVPKN
ncbi:MAG: helicase HerA-like domain-containing protein [Candidatus Woesearchaeota archaeon]